MSALVVSISWKAINRTFCLTFSTPEQYALMEVSYTLIRMLQVFPTIQSRDPDPWLESIGISLCNGNGAKVAFEAA